MIVISVSIKSKHVRNILIQKHEEGKHSRSNWANMLGHELVMLQWR